MTIAHVTAVTAPAEPDMPGPLPKDPSERRNRNPKLRGEWVDVTTQRLDAADTILPDRCYVDPDNTWDNYTVEAWDAWRHDPVSAYYGPGDIQLARDTIRLYHLDFERNATEISRRLDKLALSPKGKRDLRFRVQPS